MKFPPCPAPWKPHANFSACLLLAACLALGGCGASRHARTQPLTSLSEPNREMLRQYDSIRAFLARDDFRSAKRTAAAYQKESVTSAPAETKSLVMDAVGKIAVANSLEPQREAFRAWSAYAIPLTKEVQGFYVIHCPVPGCGDWLQTDANVDNPFMGKSMHDCGEVQK